MAKVYIWTKVKGFYQLSSTLQFLGQGLYSSIDNNDIKYKDTKWNLRSILGSILEYLRLTLDWPVTNFSA